MATSWNAADADSGIVIDSAKVVHRAGNSAAYFAGVRSDSSHADERYFELAFTGGGSYVVGIANSSALLTDYVGISTNGTGIYSASGQNIFNNVFTGTSIGSYTNADILGVHFDAVGKQIRYSRNNGTYTAWQALTTIGAGPYFCMVSLAGTCSVAARWAAADFSYSVPGTASAWDTGGGGGGGFFSRAYYDMIGRRNV